ncbi:uncharacterized protein LOC113049601 [Carassius auratus]|uniref:Uncharacterized protein LOC113049601 n=1 Tax=Carassius auratus TaxID=7957 RepID=A0A6P6K687_CARAU|nr:uncharacterized protein LOC113049601 [Carassius auratus]
MDPKTDTEVDSTEEQKDQRPTITGNKYFIFSPGKTFKAKEDIIRKALQQKSGQLTEVLTVEECDVILVFCVIVSRAGTDIDSALNELNDLSESKPAVFMVLHHTFDVEKIVPDSSRFVSRENTLTVDCLFHEDEGFPDCVKNRKALARIDQWLQPQLEQTGWIPSWLSEYVPCFNFWHTQVDTEMLKETSCEPIPKVEPEYKILVLLGMSVLEKTAVEYVIFGREESLCDASPAPLMKITVDTGVVEGEQVTVINTAGWFSSWLSLEEMKHKIQFCISMSSHRPYALLLVIPKEQYFEEIKWKEVFEESWEKVIILFTVKDEKQKQGIQYQVNQTKLRNQFHILNISKPGDRSQVSELLKQVKKTVAGNGGQSSYCTLL